MCWLLVAACVATPRVDGLRGVERIGPGRGGVLQVYSLHGIGSFEIEGPSPARICFHYDADRPFTKLEGFDLTRLEGSAHRGIPVAIDGGCARIEATRDLARYRVTFVDHYR